MPSLGLAGTLRHLSQTLSSSLLHAHLNHPKPTMRPDPSILRTLSLTPDAQITISPHGGSSFARTSRITATKPDGPTSFFFLKTSTSKDAQVMFRGEHASLNAIHAVVPTLCPRSIGWGELEEGSGYFLITEFLDLRSGGKRGSGASLAKKLGELHSKPAPVPEGYEKPMFGFPVETCCGDTVQGNTWRDTWAEFYGEERLLMILGKAETSNGKDKSLRDLVERVVEIVVPRLLGEGHLGGKEGIKPVVVHGDLWSGNKGRGLIGERTGVEDVVFDPSACYAHSEFELGIMGMFGGFGGSFMREYHEVARKTEPVEEYEGRVKLYEL
jgi:protein-ribulosamine 3-kinase